MSFSDYLRYAADKRRRDPLAYVQKRLIVGSSKEVGVDVILRMETLQNDWDQLFPQLGIRDPLKLPLVNSSKHKDYRTYYSSEDIAFVREHWKEDIEAFGYNFE